MLVLLLVADSVRHDAPGYGGGPARSPTLDRLAAEGTVFPHAVASAGWTVPSLVSVATGAYPHRVGVARWRHPFPRRRPTLMSAFAAAGFEVHTLAHNPRWCLANSGQQGEPGDSQDPETVRRALRLPRGADRLVVLHHWWTHLPYRQEAMPRDRWRAACDVELQALGEDPATHVPRLRDAYHAALEHMDGALLPRWLDDACRGGGDVLLLFTADHGENWGESLPPGRRVEHLYDLHGRWLSDETTRVPLLLWGRARGSAVRSGSGPIPAGRLVPGLARGVDLAPTLCGLAGVPWPGPLPDPRDPPIPLADHGIGPDGLGLRIDGVSLAPAALGGLFPATPFAMTVTSHNAVVPARYPKEGKRLWRRFGLRGAARRYTWDRSAGIQEAREAPELVGVEDAPRSLMRALRRRVRRVAAGTLGGAATDAAAFRLLAKERAGAVEAGELLESGLFPGDEAALADGEPGGEASSQGPAAEPGDRAASAPGGGGRQPADPLPSRLRTLGYLD